MLFFLVFKAPYQMSIIVFENLVRNLVTSVNKKIPQPIFNVIILTRVPKDTKNAKTSTAYFLMGLTGFLPNYNVKCIFCFTQNL